MANSIWFVRQVVETGVYSGIVIGGRDEIQPSGAGTDSQLLRRQFAIRMYGMNVTVTSIPATFSTSHPRHRELRLHPFNAPGLTRGRRHVSIFLPVVHQKRYEDPGQALPRSLSMELLVINPDQISRNRLGGDDLATHCSRSFADYDADGIRIFGREGYANLMPVCGLIRQ